MDKRSLECAFSNLPLPAFRFYSSTGSTNDRAAEWAEQGAADGCVVVADEQTAGRGRLQRNWITRQGTALAFSVILRARLAEVPLLALFSPLGGLGVAAAIEEVFPLKPEIKWPNDVLLGRKKVCGILAESTWMNGEPKAIILGIGINLAPSSVPPDDEVLFPATCLEEASGQAVEREAFLAIVIKHLFSWREQLGSLAFFDAWRNRLAFKGEQVKVTQPGFPPLEGKLKTVSDDGQLELEMKDGSLEWVQVGDVHLRPVSYLDFTSGG